MSELENDENIGAHVVVLVRAGDLDGAAQEFLTDNISWGEVGLHLPDLLRCVQQATNELKKDKRNE